MSNCSTCGLPEELCMCEVQKRETQSVRITTDRRRYGKLVTIVEGIDSASADDLGTELKKLCAAGGTVKDGRIEIQGNHKKSVREKLEKMGYTVS